LHAIDDQRDAARTRRPGRHRNRRQQEHADDVAAHAQRRRDRARDARRRCNIDGLEQQIPSAIIYGLSAAPGGKITFKNGATVQSNSRRRRPTRCSR
jgi:hypothetical protein